MNSHDYARLDLQVDEMPVAMRGFVVQSDAMPVFTEKARDAARRKLGKIIRDAREEAELTQRDLAYKLPRQADGNQVSRWETGKNTVDHDRLEELVRILKLDPDEVWDLWFRASMKRPRLRRRDREAARAATGQVQELRELADQAAAAAGPSRQGSPQGASRSRAGRTPPA